MCTSISYKGIHHLFGRNLDLDYTFNQEVVVTPRNFKFNLRNGEVIDNHHAIIGMAVISNHYPLYFDATNEKCLSVAGLNYPKTSHYFEVQPSHKTITSFEVIPYILTQCASINEVKKLFSDITITNEAFSENFPTSPLHWLVSDSKDSIVIESNTDGLHIYDNQVGVLTNNPSFPMQLFNLNNYRSLSTKPLKNTFCQDLEMDLYSNGMGAIGLPGDLSSMSRFVRATFTKENILKGQNLEEDIYQFFHVLNSVEQQKGICDVGNQEYEYTIYSSCCDTDTGIYYYKTYNNSQINAVSLFKEDLSSSTLSTYPLSVESSINYIN